MRLQPTAVSSHAGIVSDAIQPWLFDEVFYHLYDFRQQDILH